MRAEEFWQELLPPGSIEAGVAAGGYAATLADGRQLMLPIRAVPGGETGLASLIINQAGFAVQAELARLLGEKLAAFGPEVVVGMPTLGLTVASAVAERLGHGRYVPLGTSRKFWYEDALSVPLSSITTPEGKRLWLDPRPLPLLAGRRVALVDDVLSSGNSIAAGLALLRAVGVAPVAIGAVMLQTERWREAVGDVPVAAVFATPALERDGGGWRVAGQAR